MSEKVKLTVEMEVTVPQALTLQAMFETWSSLSNIGASRYVSFFVDGDGSFHPNCVVSTDKEIPELTGELRELASDHKGTKFDFNNIDWKLDNNM